MTDGSSRGDDTGERCDEFGSSGQAQEAEDCPEIAFPTFANSSQLRERAHALIPGGATPTPRATTSIRSSPRLHRARARAATSGTSTATSTSSTAWATAPSASATPIAPVVEAVRARASQRLQLHRARRDRGRVRRSSSSSSCHGAEMVKFCKDGSTRPRARCGWRAPTPGATSIAICGDHPFFSGRRLVHRHHADERRHSAGDAGAHGEVPLQRHRSVKALFDRASGPDRRRASSSRAQGEPTRRTASCTSCSALCHDDGALLHPRRDDHRLPLARTAARRSCYGIDAGPLDLRQGDGQRLLRVGAGRQARVHALGGLDQTDKPRVFLLSTTHGARDPRARRRDRDHARSTGASR